MKTWLGLASLTAGAAMALVWWLAPSAPEQAPPAPSANVAKPPPAQRSTATTPLAPAFSVTPVPASIIAEPEPDSPAHLSTAEASSLMQLMAEKGDPRSPALLPSQPRTRADAATLADPALYADFEAQQTRSLIQVYTAGVQQIPQIRERIEQAARDGERNAAELEEAWAALEQLEMLQRTLAREAPEMLP